MFNQCYLIKVSLLPFEKLWGDDLVVMVGI